MGRLSRAVLVTVTIGLSLARLARAQDPLKTLPRNYWLEFENDQVRVVHVRYGPHESLPVHEHPRASTLYVYLSDSGPVRFEHKEGGAFTMTRPPARAGDLRLNAGRVETHTVVNESAMATEFLRVELKRTPTGKDGFNARMKEDGALWRLKEIEQVVFERPPLRIVRWGVLEGRQRRLEGGPESVWIALAGVTVNGKPIHSGQTWAGPAFEVKAGARRAEFVEVVQP